MAEAGETTVVEQVGEVGREGPEWKHVVVKELKKNQQPRVKCLYCDKVFSGGATRIRAHLLGDKPAMGVAKCLRVQDISMEAFNEMKNLQAEKDSSNEEKAKRRKLTELSRSLINPRSSSDSQSNLPARFKIMEAENVDKVWATAFYANGIPFHLSEDPHFQEAVKITAQQAAISYKPPSAWRLSHALLDGAVTNMDAELQVDFIFVSSKLSLHLLSFSSSSLCVSSCICRIICISIIIILILVQVIDFNLMQPMQIK